MFSLSNINACHYDSPSDSPAQVTHIDHNRTPMVIDCAVVSYLVSFKLPAVGWQP